MIGIFVAVALSLGLPCKGQEARLNITELFNPARFHFSTSFNDQDVLSHLNDLRTHPRRWGRLVDSLITLWDEGKPPRMLQHLLGSEGVQLLYEVKSYIDTVTPQEPLRTADCLKRAAHTHARDVARHPNGNPHVGSNGHTLERRILAECERIRAFGECIDMLSPHGSTVILRLLFDPDVPDRGHRRQLFEPDYSLVGIAGAPCTNHPVLGTGYIVVISLGSH